MTLSEETNSDSRDKGTIAQAVHVLDWFACQRGNHRWMFVEDIPYCYRTCVRCGRTEHSEPGVPGECRWRSYPTAEVAFIREDILANGNYWDNHYSRDDWNPDWDDPDLRDFHNYWDFQASLRSPRDESDGVHR